MLGAQRPRVANVPRYGSSAGQEAIELAKEAGLILDPWQEFVLEGALGEKDDGTWSAFEIGLLVPRQNGKGGILEARELAGLFLFDEDLILHSAHEFKTAHEAFQRILELIQSNVDFDSKVRTVRTSHGEEGIELKSGQRLRFVARSTSSGRGFTGDTVVLDEAYALTAKQLAALLPTLSARPNPQIWYTSTIGDATAVQLNQIRRRGHAGGSGMAFFEWSAPDDADLDDRRAWRQANPALGIRITEEYIEKEREALDDDDFGRERLGIPTIGARVRVIPSEKWDDVQDRDAAPTAPLSFGLDVLPDRSAGAIVAVGGGAVELVDHRPGVTWIRNRAVRLAKKWKASIVVDGLGPAASIADEIEKRGVDVQKLTASEVAAGCERLHDAVLGGDIAVRPHEVLNAAVAGAVKKTLGDRWRWSRTRSTSDVTPLMAASIALVAEEAGEDFAFVV